MLSPVIYSHRSIFILTEYYTSVDQEINAESLLKISVCLVWPEHHLVDNHHGSCDSGTVFMAVNIEIIIPLGSTYNISYLRRFLAVLHGWPHFILSRNVP